MNLGNPGEFTMSELADLVLEETGSSSKVIHCPLPQDDPKQRRPDTSLAQGKLGWSPTVSLHEGLKPTVTYFRSLLSEIQLARIDVWRTSYQ